MANEKFVSQNQNDEVVKETFTLFGYSVLSVVVVIALLWGYNTGENMYLFIIIYSIIIILYTVIIISLVVMNKKNYDITSYTILFGTTIFTIFLTFFIGVFFVYKYFSSTSLKKSSDQIINYSYKY
jgi:amino acid transporter